MGNLNRRPHPDYPTVTICDACVNEDDECDDCLMADGWRPYTDTLSATDTDSATLESRVNGKDR